MTRNPIAAALLSLALSAPGGASAGLVIWELGGSIERAFPDLIVDDIHAEDVIEQLEAVGVTPGNPWSARVQFDPDIAAAPCGGCIDWAAFNGATVSIDFTAGGYSASTPDGTRGDAFSFSYSDDTISRSGLAFFSLMSNESSELLAYSATVEFASIDPTELFAATLPMEPPDVDALGPYGATFHMVGSGFVRNSDLAIFYGGPPFVSQSFAINGRITSIAPVPEPSLGALVLAAAAATAIRRRARALP